MVAVDVVPGGGIKEDFFQYTARHTSVGSRYAPIDDMATRAELIAHMTCVANVVRSAQLKRALTAAEANPRQDFWKMIYGVLLDVAVLEWCKVFGANGEPTHWKRIVTDHDAFRSALLAAVRIDSSTWKGYWRQMKDYRDNFVSHSGDITTVANYPDLTIALDSSCFYYQHLVDEAKRSHYRIIESDLRTFADRFIADATQIALRALAATAGMDEPVLQQRPSP